MERFVCMSIDEYLESDENCQISKDEYFALTLCVDGFLYLDKEFNSDGMKRCMMYNDCTARELKECYEQGCEIIAVHVNSEKLECALRPLASRFEADNLIHYAFGNLRFDKTVKKIVDMVV